MAFEMRSGFRQIENSVVTFTNETRSSIAALGTSISERSRPQWQAVGVMVSVVVVLGGLVYWPIRESTNDLKAQDIETSRFIQGLTSETGKAIQTLAANTVSRQEMDWRAQRRIEDPNRMEIAIADIRRNLVPRTEFEAYKIEVQRQLDQRRTP